MRPSHPVSQYPMDPNQVHPDFARQEEQDVEEPQELSVSVAVAVERRRVAAARTRMIRISLLTILTFDFLI